MVNMLLIFFHCLHVLFCYVQQVVDGARVSYWACVNFCHDLRGDVVLKFCSDLVKWSRTTGVVINVNIMPFIALLSTNIFALLPV